VNYPDVTHLCYRHGIISKEYGATGRMVAGPVANERLEPVDFCPVCGLASRARVEKLIEEVSHD
jgi:hypothetical protein